MPGRDDKPRGFKAWLRKRRWGVYTLAFLILAFVMVVVSSTQGHYTILTLLGLLVGFVGAGYCTFKGLRELDLHRLLK